jgi:hypothetical protein
MGILGSVFNFLGLGRYSPVLPTVAPGATGELQLTSRGLLRVAVEASADGEAAPRARYRTDPEAASAEIASSTPRKVVDVIAQNRSANVRYFQLFDTATSPANGASPLVSYRVDANGFLNLGYQAAPLEFNVGVAWAVSDTPDNLTQSTDKFFVEIVLQDAG